jgi:hypothetical protein
MECVNDHALDVLHMAIVLAAFALAGLIYTAINARRSAIGGRLLEVCGNDWQTAALAVDNVRQENELVARHVLRDIKGKRK